MRIFLTTVIFALGFQLFGESVEEKLKRLSFEERSYLKFFFGDLIYYDSFGHVLFYENKSLCMIGLIKNGHGSFREKLPSKGWEVWKKLSTYFHTQILFFAKK